MKQTITNDTPIAMLTVGQLREVLSITEPTNPQIEEYTQTRNYVYGLAGIRRLFNVSHTTAQRYKNTFLAPSVIQNGRKLVIDVEKAIALFNENRG